MSVRRAQDERIEGTPDGLNAITEIMDVPDTPSIGTATDGGNVDASVTFTAATTGGTPASYTVTSTPGSITGTGSSSPITVSGLSTGTAYTFKVKAANAAGTFGPESSASNSVTPAMPIPGAYYSLATTTLASTAASVTFAGIPSGYKHLQLRILAQNSDSGKSLNFTFNGDTATNYSRHILYGTGASALATADINTSYCDAYISPTGTFGATIIDILDYANINKYKTTKALGGYDANGSGWITFTSGNWRNTNAITSIAISSSANFVQYSSFALYGVK